jgi:hypothetical protein
MKKGGPILSSSPLSSLGPILCGFGREKKLLKRCAWLLVGPSQQCFAISLKKMKYSILQHCCGGHGHGEMVSSLHVKFTIMGCPLFY